MKIISKHKDYYDGGSVYGIDETRIFVREIDTDSLSDETFQEDRVFNMVAPHINAIGFCGKIYPFVKLEHKYADEIGCRVAQETRFLFGEELLENYWRINNEGFMEIEDKYAEKYYNARYRFTSKERFQKELIDNIKGIENSTRLNQLFLKYKTPYFLMWVSQNYSKHNTILPNLKKLQFYKVKNTVEAFTEIEQYISNVLVEDQQGNCPVGGDLVVAQSKGYDDMSFRKEKNMTPKRKKHR